MAAAFLVVALALSACGGGTDEVPAPDRDRALIAAARAGDAARALIEAVR